MSRRPLRALVLAAVACAGLASTAVACTAATPDTPDTEPDRLSGELWRNPQGHASVAIAEAQAGGRTGEAASLDVLAEQPTATWFASPGDPYSAVSEVSRAAAAAGQLSVLVAYFVPMRDCGSSSSGGAPDAGAYLSWIGSFAAALADRPAVGVLEPDAIAHAIVGCAGVRPEERYRLLAQEVEILDRQPRTRVYLDAGNAGWVDDLPVLAGALRRSNVDQADGFALNVSNFETTDVSARFGLALSQQLQADQPSRVATPHFVIDTSRNGAGPPRRPAPRTPGATCPDAGWARFPPPTPTCRASTPCSGSSSRATPTAPAAAARPPVRGRRRPPPNWWRADASACPS
ncbi:endoglucanase [Modestobacter sp. DSM 44400]|nr:glycoside hydrolase family 6 protein [Modestobacter sp. DSM 44400]SDY58968.1 endoglucanase [Modestobacter sp. DSM 44400]